MPRAAMDGEYGRAADLCSTGAAGWQALDSALEALIVAAFAAALAAASVFARSHLKTVAAASAVIGLVAWFLSSRLG